MDTDFKLNVILYDCPLGTLFYFSDIDKYLGYAGMGYQESLGGFIFYFNNYFEVIKNSSCKYYDLAINNYGSPFIDCKDCVIFPSKENQDWESFIAPWKDPKFIPRGATYNNIVRLKLPYYYYNYKEGKQFYMK